MCGKKDDGSLMAIDYDRECGTVTWSASRSAGLDRLAAFAPNAGRSYAATRNFDLGPDDRSNVSALSPWIRHRLVLEEEVLRRALSHHRFSAAEKFVQEVHWRTYFKGWLEHRPQVWSRYREDLLALIVEADKDASLRSRYVAAVEGKTGVDCFDSWSAELVETGYLHNHTRMWFASIWIFTLELPWQLGADFFYRHLLDGDPASNTLGWRWVAGLHTKGKTYLARTSNIARFTNCRFDPKGQLARQAPALTEPDIGAPVPLRPAEALPDGEPFGLLVTEEDCLPESLGLARDPAAVLGLTATDGRSPLPVSPAVHTFTDGALSDALSRAEERFSAGTERSDEEDWGALLADWAGRSDVRTIATAHAPAGPVADRLRAAGPVLERAGIRLVQLSRPYDTAAWPHATKGFFGLKAKIPMLLARLDISS